MTSGQGDDVFEKEVRIAARPETIFPFFTDPAKMALWMGVEHTLEPTPGGVFRVNITGRDVAAGQYVEISPPNRVVMIFGWEGDGNPLPPGSSTLEITLVEDGAETVLTLRHSGLSSDQRDGHGEGWEHYLERLIIVAKGGDPGTDPWTAAPTEAT